MTGPGAPSGTVPSWSQPVRSHHPQMLERTLAETGFSIADAVMIGDATTDIQMGNAIGMDTIAVTWGAHNRDQFRATNPTHVVDKPCELTRFTKD